MMTKYLLTTLMVYLVVVVLTILQLAAATNDGDGGEDGGKTSLREVERRLPAVQSDSNPASDTPTSQNRDAPNPPILMCGTKDSDVIDENNNSYDHHRDKRYVVSRFRDGSVNKWDITRLTWTIKEPSRQMDIHKQRRVIRESLQVWSDVTPMDFVMVDSDVDADIEFRFARRKHGPSYDPVFDGKASANAANIYGHAWGPGKNRKGIAGDVHIDEDDDWSELHRLKGVLVHELGHSMGLKHSDDPEAIMFAIYRDATELANDDIRGIQSLYGSKSSGRRVTSRPETAVTPRPRTRRPYVTRRPPVTRRPTYTRRPSVTRRPPYTRRPYVTRRPAIVTGRPPYTRRPYATRRPYVTDRPYVTVTEKSRTVPTLRPDSPCLASDINAVVEDPFSVLEGLYYVFIGDTVHHITYDGSPLSSMSLAESFPGAPKDPDVVFSLSEKKSVFFIKDHQSYEFKHTGLTKDSPKSIRHMNFPEKPSYAISLFDVEGQRRLYLFGKQYWWSFYIDHPRPSSHYEIRKFSRDLTSDVTFATQWWDNQLYVVSRDSYIILDTSSRGKTHERPHLGKPHWLRPLCTSDSPMMSTPSLLSLALVSLGILVLRR